MRSETAMGEHVNAQSKDSEYVRAVYKMSGLVEHRMRTPLYWNKVLYNLLGPGREHDRCLKTLHDFTVKVSWLLPSSSSSSSSSSALR